MTRTKLDDLDDAIARLRHALVQVEEALRLARIERTEATADDFDDDDGVELFGTGPHDTEGKR